MNDLYCIKHSVIGKKQETSKLVSILYKWQTTQARSNLNGKSHELFYHRQRTKNIPPRKN